MREARQDQGQELILSLRVFALVCAILLALHLLLTVVACPPEVVFGARPYGVADYHTHYQQAHTVGRAIERFGETWAYDPQMLAGVPVGLFFDVDNKAHALLTYALTRLGLDEPLAFNLFTLLSCLVAPLSLFVAARLFRLGRGAQLFALGLGVGLWHFDSGLRYFWSSGMVSFSTVAHGSTVALALLYRVVEERRWLRHAVPLALLLPLLLLVHVWAFVICVVPMAGLYLARARKLPLAGHIQVWGVVAATLLVNSFWLLPALSHLDLLAPAAVLGQANPVYLLADYLGVARLPFQTDFIFLHTFYRVVAMLGAVVTLWVWRRQRDGRFGYATLALAWLWGLAYVGGLLPVLRATEPYRFIAPAMLLSAVLAGAEISRQLARRPWRALSKPVLAGVVVLLLLLAPRPLREMLYFLPELSPPAYVGAGDPEAAGDKDFKPAPPAHRPFRLQPIPERIYEVARRLDGLCGGVQGRVLVREWPLAETLRWATRCPILGGFGERRTIHESANLFRWKDDPRLKGQRLAGYLRRYAVRYIVVIGPPSPALELRPDLLRLKAMVAGHRIHEVLRPSTLLARGAGRVQASLNRIEVQGVRPDRRTGDLMLRFHYMRTLGCSPTCRVEQEPVPGDPAGFIRVVFTGKTPTRIVIRHQY